MAKVAFLGLGVMGYPMAGHLQSAGHDVTVYNRTAAKSKAWAEEHGGTAAATPALAAKGAEYVLCCVGNDDDLRSVCLGDDGAFAAHENIFMLPHIGSATTRTRDAMGFRALDNLDAFFAGDKPKDQL